MHMNNLQMPHIDWANKIVYHRETTWCRLLYTIWANIFFFAIPLDARSSNTMQQNTLTISPQSICIESAPIARKNSLTMQQHKAFVPGRHPMQLFKNKNISNNMKYMNLLGYKFVRSGMCNFFFLIFFLFEV